MKHPILLAASVTLLLASGAAVAKDLSKAELDTLTKAGTILPIAKLEAAVTAKYPGGKLEGGEIEQHRRGYVYEVEVTDAAGDEWDLELDAAKGTIVRVELD